MPITNGPPTSNWTWTGSSITGWKAHLEGGFIDPEQPLAPDTVIIHRRDGAVSQHKVLALIQPGSNPVISVHASGTPVAGHPSPIRPAVRWKHSKLRSRCNHNGTKATVFRIRKDGNSMWTYHTVTAGLRHPTAGYPTFSTRKAAVHACQRVLPAHVTKA